MTNREYVEYQGRRYWLQSSGRYFQSGVKTDTERLLHRRVWSDANGPIPPDHHVHHINGDWRDNRLENLECVLGVEHSRQHMLERVSTPEGRASALAGLEAGRDAAKEWHASEAGRAWHSEHGARTWEGREPVAKICEACGSEFSAYFEDRAKYCSSACGQRIAFRRYFTDPRTCAHCGETFMANRHRDTRFCSKNCSMRSRAKKVVV